ncbi:hypothetical protein A2Y83_03350 [Candidatus Falkowbacteria bacterium RBG_13_39_14]|uniref:Uncharacterized protein n=1 Tax=Candidatus Falkowbacteria bacterium RBG_13_39_14 TaxID=1797985 RepID=A0A1F5S5R4_9BACT|nr:MAG: hypothetical protein A2Y83_03350 [Candidatus Falkowbacteria bacterium RBG_13_39_14]
MKWKIIVILFAAIFFSGCIGSRFYFNKPLNTYLPSPFKTSRSEAYKLTPAPESSFYLVSFESAFFWEKGVSWKIIVFDENLYRVYISFAFDADGDGYLEALIPASYYGMRFFLVSHDNVVLLGPSSRIEREKNHCLKDLEWKDILRKAPALNSETGHLIGDGASIRDEVLRQWERGMENKVICKVLTPKQIKDLKCWAPSAEWWKISNLIANISGIYGIWDSTVWGLDWFKLLRSALEGNYLLANLLRCPDNSIYGTALLSRMEGADLLWAFEEYKKRKPGFFRKLYLEMEG